MPPGAGPCLPDAAVWRADALAQPGGAVRPSGHAALDAALPGGGWPVGALVELLQTQPGQGEWRLLAPVLAATTGVLVLVAPPHMPFVPALAAQGLAPARLLRVGGAGAAAPDPAARVWAAEQALRCAGVAAVLAWLPQVRPEQLRRLQLAAQRHGTLLFVMRPARARHESSPAVLRLLVDEGGPAAAAPDATPCADTVHTSTAPVSIHTSTAPVSTASPWRLTGPSAPPSAAPATATEPAPAGDPDALVLHLLKRRGPPLAQPLHLDARPPRLAALLRASRGQGSRRRQATPGPAAPASAPTSASAPLALPNRLPVPHALDRPRQPAAV